MRYYFEARTHDQLTPPHLDAIAASQCIVGIVAAPSQVKLIANKLWNHLGDDITKIRLGFSLSQFDDDERPPSSRDFWIAVDDKIHELLAYMPHYDTLSYEERYIHLDLESMLANWEEWDEYEGGNEKIMARFAKRFARRLERHDIMAYIHTPSPINGWGDARNKARCRFMQLIHEATDRVRNIHLGYEALRDEEDGRRQKANMADIERLIGAKNAIFGYMAAPNDVMVACKDGKCRMPLWPRSMHLYDNVTWYAGNGFVPQIVAQINGGAE